MTETLDRIAARTAAYKLAERERALLGSYYRCVLLKNPSPPTAEELIKVASAARNVASMWTDLDWEVSAKVPLDNHSPISQAARVMYLAAELFTDDELTAHWAREACIAYLQSGNVAAARVALDLARRSATAPGDGDLLLDAVLSMRKLSSSEKALLPLGLRKPWTCRTNGAIKKTRRLLHELASNTFDSRVDKSVAYRISQSLPLMKSLSLPCTLSRANHELPDWYRKALIRDQRMVLLPSQRRALGRLLKFDDSNGLLCTPTSSGKTLVAEVISILELADAKSGVVILVVPYQAIAYTVEETIKRRLKDADITVVSAYGEDAVDQASLAAKKVFLIATPEKLDAVLVSNPTLLSRTLVVALDELHLVSQSSRGAFYECLIARMLQEQELTQRPKRIIGMSAVIANTESLAKWLRVPKKCVVVGRWRPNPLIACYWGRNDSFFVVTDANNIKDETVDQIKGFITGLPSWPPSALNEHAMAKVMVETLGKRISWYAERWNRRNGGPVVVFCSSRAQTRELATQAANAKRSTSQLHPAVETVIRLIDSKFPFLSILKSCLRKSIAYHNASLPTVVRRRLEDAFQKRAIETVFATTTLAEGSDFPFRSVVIASPSHYDYETQSHSAMSPLLIRNIAGRGGRSSGHLMGDVVQMFSPFKMIDAEGAGIDSQKIFLKHLLDPSESKVKSVLSGDEATSGTLAVANAHLSSSFTKVVKRWPKTDGAIRKFRKHMFAPEVSGAKGAEREAEFIGAALSADVFGEPVATYNSPLRLTELGELITLTGYDLDTAREIWRRMKSQDWFTKEPSRKEVLELAAALSGAVPEIREVRNTNSRPLKLKNFVIVMEGLLDGDSVVDAYLRAESSASKDVKSRADSLVKGSAPESSPSHARIETFIEDIKNKIIYELPKLVRAMSLLCAYAAQQTQPLVFSALLSDLTNARKTIE